MARAAGIGVGTLFNYFATKEILGIALISDSLAIAEQQFLERRRGDESLEEDLFAFIQSGLRRLEEHRPYAAEVLEMTLNPLSRRGRCREADELRDRHWEVVADLMQRHGSAHPPASAQMHLYWSLYLGIIGCWSRDTSEHGSETLALVDQAMRLFAAAVSQSRQLGEVSI